MTTHVRAQARALRARGHDVAIFGPASGALPDGERALSSAISITFGGTEPGLGLDPLSAFRPSAEVSEVAWAEPGRVSGLSRVNARLLRRAQA